MPAATDRTASAAPTAEGRPVHSLPEAEAAATALNDRPSAFFNALLTEHFVLQSIRGVTVSESSTRASIYLMTLSSSLVAYGFLAQSEFAVGYLAVVFPVIVLLGVFTYERLVQTSLEDVVALQAMQRIRSWYGTLLPGAEAFFPRPRGAHAPNEMLDIGRRASWRGVFFTLSSAVAVVNSIVAGAGTGLVLASFADPTGALTVGVIVAIVLAVLHGVYQERRYAQVQRVGRENEEGSQP
jgi:hypothetical protein